MEVVALTPVRVPVAPDAPVEPAIDEILRAFGEAVEIGTQSLLMLASPLAQVAPSSMKESLSERIDGLIRRAPPSLQLAIEPSHPLYAGTCSGVHSSIFAA